MKSCLKQEGTGKSLAEKNEREMWIVEINTSIVWCSMCYICDRPDCKRRETVKIDRTNRIQFFIQILNSCGKPNQLSRV
jgi:hypothetical protein